MKQAYLMAGLLGMCTAGAMAIDLNTDAMKKMQEQGHQIVEQGQGQGGRTFSLPNGQCLQAAGGNLVSGKCNGKPNQQWNLDGSGRLVSHDGNCVAAGKQAGANAILQQCGGAGTQKWQLDGAKRLANPHGLCLQADGKNVVAAECGNGNNQKWG